MFAFAKKKEAEVESVTVEEHQIVQETFHLALSSIDESIQSIRRSREKARAIFVAALSPSEK